MELRRKKRFIDPILQGYFIFPLIAVELIILTAGVFYLSISIAQLLDEQIYRNKMQLDEALVHNIGMELFSVSLMLLAINVTVFLLWRLVWLVYIQKMRAEFRRIINKIRIGEFDPVPQVSIRHPLIEHSTAWFEREKHREEALLQLAKKLDTSSVEDKEKVLVEIAELVKK